MSLRAASEISGCCICSCRTFPRSTGQLQCDDFGFDQVVATLRPVVAMSLRKYVFTGWPEFVSVLALAALAKYQKQHPNSLLEECSMVMVSAADRC